MQWQIALLCIVWLIGFSKQTPLTDENDFSTYFETANKNGDRTAKQYYSAEEEEKIAE